MAAARPRIIFFYRCAALVHNRKPRIALEARCLAAKLFAMPKAKAASANAQIHAVVGSDESEVKRAAAELAAQLAPPDAGDFGIEVIDGAGDNSEQSASRIRATIDALQTLPFFGGKLVWLKNANCLGDSIIGRSATAQSALEGLAEVLESGLPRDVTFLLSATEVDKRRSFYKSLGKLAELQVIDKLDASKNGWEEEATEIVRRRANTRGIRFDEDALDLFVLLTGGDTRQIDNELEKIDLYVGQNQTTTADDVRMLVPLSRAGVIFELGNALAACDLERALALVRGLLDQGESAIGILLVAILPTIRNLLLAKDLMERHRLSRPSAPFSFISAVNRLPASATEHLPRKKDGTFNAYPLGLAAMAAHRFQTTQLISGLEACLAANLQIVSSQLDHELILTEIVVKLLARG